MELLYSDFIKEHKVMIREKIKEYYEIFKGLPSTNSIVRLNIENDAFVILVYDLIFRKSKLNEQISINDMEEIEKCIVPPPDDKIDIFYEEEIYDEQNYHIVQVKNSKLSPDEIKTCFSDMKRTINNYLNDPKSVNVNLRNIISSSNFDIDNKNNCIYYVVHTGDRNSIRGQKDDENIITLSDLELIQQSLAKYRVPMENIQIDKKSNFLDYNYFESQSTQKPRAVLCNLNAYDLAVICNKYINSKIGRNILFGQNLREALTKKSKTFKSMCSTIDKEPEYFWYYNNGISIIAEEFNIIENGHTDYVHLKNFSIINGAQTTSTFGNYLKDLQRDSDSDKIDNLKKIFVTARIVETKEDTELGKKIAINNNTQNPLSTRDMVSKNVEQEQLQRRYLEGSSPNLFIYIRTGEQAPKYKPLMKHQTINNDELAQLVFASFLRSPYIAKDKKNTLFNIDNSTDEYPINEEYSKVFNFSNNDIEKGELFKRTKDEINELLFIKFLHNRSKKILKDSYNESILQQERILNDVSSDETEKRSAADNIEVLKKFKQINNINLFYNIALYYEFKRQFDSLFKAHEKKFDYDRFYSKEKKYERELVDSFAELFNTETISLINELGSADPSKFVRLKSSQDIFLKKLAEKMNSITFKNKYKSFLEKFKE